MENYFVTMNRNFKNIGFIKFKIGYVIRPNSLKMKKPPRKPSIEKESIEKKEE